MSLIDDKNMVASMGAFDALARARRPSRNPKAPDLIEAGRFALHVADREQKLASRSAARNALLEMSKSASDKPFTQREKENPFEAFQHATVKGFELGETLGLSAAAMEDAFFKATSPRSLWAGILAHEGWD